MTQTYYMVLAASLTPTSAKGLASRAKGVIKQEDSIAGYAVSMGYLERSYLGHPQAMWGYTLTRKGEAYLDRYWADFEQEGIHDAV